MQDYLADRGRRWRPWRPSSLVRRHSDGTTWTASHPGYPAGRWWFRRAVRGRWFGWWTDYADVWRPARWDEFSVLWPRS